MGSRRPGRYLESFLEPVAPLCLSMGPNEPTATRFRPEFIDFMPSIFSNIPQNRRWPIFIIARSRHLAFFRGVGPPPDFSGMSNYVDSLPPNFLLIQEIKFLNFPSEKVRKQPNMEIYQICVCVWCAYSIISSKK